MELNGTSGLKGYPKLRSFITWKFLMELPISFKLEEYQQIKKFHNLKELGGTYWNFDYERLPYPEISKVLKVTWWNFVEYQ